MVVGVNCGHTIMGARYGANGIINESVYTRKVGYALMEILKNSGVTVIDCTVDKASSQSEYLKAVIDFANNKELDWFLGIHFNASIGHIPAGLETAKNPAPISGGCPCSQRIRLGYIRTCPECEGAFRHQTKWMKRKNVY